MTRADDAAGLESAARSLALGGVLNWSGPRVHAVVVDDGTRTMTPEAARAAVDFVFSTPRPALEVELVGGDGRARATARFAREYAIRRAEWGRRGLKLRWRSAAAPSEEFRRELDEARCELVAEMSADGPPRASAPFPAARARVRVGARASDPKGWVDALSRAGIASVLWVPDAAADASPASASRFASFCADALRRMIDVHDQSDLRDETAIALLSARPFELPGLELLSELAYGPDGRVHASEEGLRRAVAGDETWVLGDAATLRFSELPEKPLVRAIAAAAWRPGHPVCADCPRRGLCALPASARGGLSGPVADAAHCLRHLAVLDAALNPKNIEKSMRTMQKWGVDISPYAC